MAIVFTELVEGLELKSERRNEEVCLIKATVRRDKRTFSKDSSKINTNN